MADDHGYGLWARVCATVTRLGQPRPRREPMLEVVQPDRVLDLHGVTIHVAFARAKAFIQDSPYGEILIITGKSGPINYEFPDWCIQWPRVASYQSQNGGGAYRVRLRPR